MNDGYAVIYARVEYREVVSESYVIWVSIHRLEFLFPFDFPILTSRTFTDTDDWTSGFQASAADTALTIEVAFRIKRAVHRCIEYLI